MSLRLAFEERRRLPPPVELRPVDGRAVHVVVQGAGDWARRAIMPDLRAADRNLRSRPGGHGLTVTYVDLDETPPGWLIDRCDLDRWSRAERARLVPRDWADRLQPNERYVGIDDARWRSDLLAAPADVAIVATPDIAHGENVRFWAGSKSAGRPLARLVLVEKPFTDSAPAALDLAAEIERLAVSHPSPATVLPVDHYLWYVSDLLTDGNLAAIDDALGDVRAIDFFMTETEPIEWQRLDTLRNGLLIDMAVHGLALISNFADLGSIEDVAVGEFGRHSLNGSDLPDRLRARRYLAETAGELSFRVGLRRGGRVNVYLRFGKRTRRRAKHFEMVGETGAYARFELTSEPSLTVGRGDGGGKRIDLARRPHRSCTRHGRAIEAYARGDGGFFATNALLVEDCVAMLETIDLVRDGTCGVTTFAGDHPRWQGSDATGRAR